MFLPLYLFWKFPWWLRSLNFGRNGPTFWWHALAIIVTKHTKSGMWSEILLFTLITSGDSFYPLVSSLLHIYVYICVRTYICMFTGNISKTMFLKYISIWKVDWGQMLCNEIIQILKLVHPTKIQKCKNTDL